jgi:hypothetical protein
MLGRHRGQIHEPESKVLVGHHPGLGILGRERIGRNLGLGDGDSCACSLTESPDSPCLVFSPSARSWL